MDIFSQVDQTHGMVWKKKKLKKKEDVFKLITFPLKQIGRLKILTKLLFVYYIL